MIRSTSAWRRVGVYGVNFDECVPECSAVRIEQGVHRLPLHVASFIC